MVFARSHSIKDHPELTGLIMLSALTGALAAIFTTPRTGYETRTRLKERGRRMKDRWRDYMHERAEEAPDMGDLAEQAKSRAAEAARKAGQSASVDKPTRANRRGNSNSKEG